MSSAAAIASPSTILRTYALCIIITNPVIISIDIMSAVSHFVNIYPAVITDSIFICIYKCARCISKVADTIIIFISKMTLGMEPVLVEEIQQGHVGDHQEHHGDGFPSGPLHHGLQFRLHHAHIGKFLHNGGQRIFHGTVRLALDQDIGPLMEHPVGYLQSAGCCGARPVSLWITRPALPFSRRSRSSCPSRWRWGRYHPASGS